MSKKVASKSHVDDAKGGHSKESQRPEPAHQYSGPRPSTNTEEAFGGVPKNKPAAAHVGPWNIPGEHEETLRRGAFPNRKQGEVKEVPNAASKARKATFGKLIHADGTSQATPSR